MEKVADNNTKALIQALEEVMRGFGAQINSQAGENFRQLNQSMAGILLAQEQSRQQINELIEAQKQAASNEADKFNLVADRLAAVNESLEGQSRQIDQSLQALTQLLTTATNSLPALDKKIVERTDQLAQGVRTALNESSKAMLEAIESLRSTSGAYILDAESRSL